MRRLIILIILIFVVCSLSIVSATGTDKAAQATDKEMKNERVYPIAPGVWYPQDGPIPEKPVRYYRVRCFPGCHKGTKYGMYPDEALGYMPIFPTSAIPGTHPEIK